MSKVSDLYVSYVLIKKLQTPFERMDAFKVGVIDKDGNFLVPRSSWDSKQKDSVSKLDVVIINIKKLAGRFLPGKVATFAAALMLLREDQIPEDDDRLFESAKVIYEVVLFEEMKLLENEAGTESSSPTNSEGQGRIDLSPIVRQDKHSVTLRVNKNTYHKCIRGKCKKERFDKYIDEESVLSTVRDYSKKFPHNSIILQDEDSGSRIFLKYGVFGSYGMRPRG